MRKGDGKTIFGTALLLMAAVLFVVVPAVQKLRALAAVRASAPPEELAQYTSVALFSAAAGLFVGIAALILLIAGIVQGRRNGKTELEHPTAPDWDPAARPPQG